MTEWQQIDDAAKNGKAVLVTYLPATSEPPIDFVRWCRGPSQGKAGWRFKGCSNKRLGYQPTHYAIPQPPGQSDG